MSKTILITGSSDGIGFETARMLMAANHQVILHGRSTEKLSSVAQQLESEFSRPDIKAYAADLSDMKQVEALAEKIKSNHNPLDVLINNAGIFKTPNPTTKDGLDIRFVVNTIAPYLLTKRLLDIIPKEGRVVNLSSAAQAPVDIDAMKNGASLSDGQAYAQSKLALTMWSRQMGLAHKETGPMIVSVNPASMLGSKMVKEAYGVAGGDLRIGADILTRAALSEEFKNAGGEYFDNDSGRFSPPHPDALVPAKCQTIVETIEQVIARN